LHTPGTATIKPFESFVVANSVQGTLKSSLNIEGTTTALEQFHWNDPVVRTEYYDLTGQKVQLPVKNSLYVVKKTRSSGKTDTVKMIN
jgi:hypothetical protein